MKHVTTLILSISFAIASAWNAHAQEVTSVVKILSGTVFTITSGDTISLLGVGNPPSGSYDLTDATEHLKKMIEGEEVILIPDPSITDPIGGAKPRYVYLLNKDMVNLRMIGDKYGRAEREPIHSLLNEFLKKEGSLSGGASSSPAPGASQFKIEIQKLLDIQIELRQGGDISTDSESVQCSGTTVKGVRCKNRTKDPSGRCRFHKNK